MMKRMIMSQVCQINPPKSVDISEEQEISFVPMEAVTVDGHLYASRTILVSKVKNYSVFRNGDILFAKITPCMENGKGCIANGLYNGIGAGSTEFSVLRPNLEYVTSEWIFYFLSQKQFRKQCQQHMTGSAGQKRVPPKYLATCEMPVPSICDQERIVARIEELFSELDKAVETLQTTKRQLAVYRQAVLKEAFEGNYPQVPLNTISTAISGYAFKSKRYTSSGSYVVVKIGNVKQSKFDFSRDLTRTDEIENGILERALLKRGDCLITLTGSRGKRDYGYVSMITNETNFLLNQRVAALRFDFSKALPQFFQYYLSSPIYRNMFFAYETGNVGQGNVGIKALQEPIVICPSLAVQKQIVTDIESRLSVCDSIEQTVDTALQQAEALRQSILKEAFEGRLV